MDFKYKQDGFTLIESMVALVILLFGILGALAMQSAAVSNTKIAADRSIAAIHTSSILSKMNSNEDYWQTVPVGFDIAIAADGTISDLGAGTDGADLEAAGTDCVSDVCSPLETAAYNLKNWVQGGTSFGSDGGISNRLPAPTTRIQRIGNDFPVMLEVTILWNEKRSTSGAPMAASFYAAGNTAANSVRGIQYTVRARP
jgi:type IV pilus assembly protein PilV